jgi:hypothetical protein
MKSLSIVKRLAVAAVAAAALTGSVTAAHALTFNTGDAVLVIYGNDNQGYVNLGNWNTLKTTGASINVSSILGAAGVSGANPIEYTVLGNLGALTPLWFGNNVDISQWTTTNKNQTLPTPFNTALTNWRGQLTNANDTARTIYSSSDALLAYTTYFGTTDTYAGAITGRRGSTDIDNILYMLERTGAAGTLAGVTTAFLNSQTGLFTMAPAAVPIPAAAVLFATGVIGLIGVARRKLMV